MDTTRVFHYFNEISRIPRGSGNEKQISDYLVDFAKKHNLFVYQDESNNILIRKSATKGYEKYQSICLQGHLDMVCEKNSDKEFDFEKDEIKIIIEDGFIKADGTTLGADNGICVAITMAILENDNIKHPELEILLTTDEEMGMLGAKSFDITKLSSKILVNIDSEEYGSIYVSSAGSTFVHNVIEFSKHKIDKDKNIFSLNLSGLKGGHSGVDINENTANASILMARLVKDISRLYNPAFINYSGGKKNNTIPREAMCVIELDTSKEKLEEILDYSINSLKHKYKGIEDDIILEIKEIPNDNFSKISYEDTIKVLDYVLNIPNAVLKMSEMEENLTKTSSNLGILSLDEIDDKKVLKVNNTIRSLVRYEQDFVANLIEKYTSKFNGKSTIKKSYNPWEYKKDSKIRDYFAKIFKDLTNKEAEIKAMHAGLETGLFYEKNENLDIISIGPDIKNPHTPDEKMSIAAVEETYAYLLNALEKFDIE